MLPPPSINRIQGLPCLPLLGGRASAEISRPRCPVDGPVAVLLSGGSMKEVRAAPPGLAIVAEGPPWTSPRSDSPDPVLRSRTWHDAARHGGSSSVRISKSATVIKDPRSILKIRFGGKHYDARIRRSGILRGRTIFRDRTRLRGAPELLAPRGRSCLPAVRRSIGLGCMLDSLLKSKMLSSMKQDIARRVHLATGDPVRSAPQRMGIAP